MFNKISYLYAINMSCGIMWQFVFMTNKVSGFIGAFGIILGLLSTCLSIMLIINRSQLNMFEALVVYTEFGLYAGWVTCATILNFCYCIKSVISQDKDKFETYDDSKSAIIAVWVATVLFMIISYTETNFIYGSVWLWAALAISDR